MSVIPESVGGALPAAGGDWRVDLVESPLFPGAIAVSKGVVSLTLLSAALNPVLFAIGFLVAVTVYTHNRLTDLGEDAVNRPEQAAVAASRKRLLGGVAAGAYAVALGLAALGGLVAVGVVVLPGVAGALYSESWLPVTEYDRLKEVPVLNTAVTAGAWALPLAYLPVAFSGAAGGATAALVAAFLFCRTAAASEVLNVRDVAGDRAAGVVTVPVAVGLRRTRHVLYGLDAASVGVLAAGAGAGHLPLPVAAVLLPGFAYSLWLTRRVGTADPDRLATAKDAEYVLLAALALVGAGFVTI